MVQNSQFEREAQAVLWVQWVFFNAVGYAVGRLFVDGFETTPVALYAVTGAFLGAFQWFVLRHYGNMQSAIWLLIWAVATALGSGFGRILAGTVFGWIPTSLQAQALQSILPRVLISGLFGLVLGVGIGLIQSAVLGTRLRKAHVWFIVNVIGWTVAFQFDAFLSIGPVIESLIKAIIASMITGVGVARIMTRLK